MLSLAAAMKGLAALFPLLVWTVAGGFVYYANVKLGRGLSIKKVPYRYLEPGWYSTVGRITLSPQSAASLCCLDTLGYSVSTQSGCCTCTV